MTVTKPSPWQDILTLGRSIRLALSRPEVRAQRAYEIFPPSTWTALNEHSTYLNFGYWRSEDDTIDDACEALAELLADAAGFQRGDRILDAGFGYGDQDFMWLERYDPAEIVGVNVTPTHVRVAQEKARERGLEDRVIFQEGSATEIGTTFEAGSFDRVVALESALHFLPRDEFFRQAYQVLRPGGVIATADIAKLTSYVREDLFATTVPGVNWYGADEYRDRLRAAGFVNVRSTSIRDQVYEPWCKWAERRLESPDFQQRATWGYRRWLRSEFSEDQRMRKKYAAMDYIIVSAEKPM